MQWPLKTARPGDVASTDPEEETPRRILIVSASMGAGHDGAARELAARLSAEGHQAEVRDFLDAAPLHLGALLKRGYEFELRHVPSAYDATYRLWYRVPWLAPLLGWVVTTIAGRRLRRWVRALRADLVVSTYPLATLCLGRLRHTGVLRIPAVNFITDFGVHPLWVHRGMDLNLAVHTGPARQARLRTGRRSVACGPVVSEAYRAVAPDARAEARRRWGLAEGAQAILIVAGSWGIGGIRETFEAIADDGRFTPVVVCGRDETTRRALSALPASGGRRSIVIGWTDEMPSLMAACDALVENAGGLTSLEAMRSGLPVISFRPIAGHGVENTSTMAELGVSYLARDIPELLAALDRLSREGPARRAQIERAQTMFVSDPAQLALGAVDQPAVVSAGYRRMRLALRSVTTAAGVLGLAWTGMTTGVGVAAAAGAGVAHPNAQVTDVAYVGVRIDSSELADPATRHQLAGLDATAVVDEQTAESDPAAMRALVREGVNVANGGRGFVYNRDGKIDRPPQWIRAHRDVEAGQQLGRLIDEPVTEFVPGRRVDAFDLMDSGHAHATVIVPEHIWTAGHSRHVGPLQGRDIYLLNGLGSSGPQLNGALGQLKQSLRSANLVPVPFSALG